MYAHQVIEDLEYTLVKTKDDLCALHTKHAIEAIPSAQKFRVGTHDDLYDVVGIKNTGKRLFAGDLATHTRLPYPVCWFDFDVRANKKQVSNYPLLEIPSRGLLVKEVSPNILFVWIFNKVGRNVQKNGYDINNDYIASIVSNSRWLMSLFGYIIYIGDLTRVEDVLESIDERINECGLGWLPREIVAIGEGNSNVFAAFCTSHASSEFIKDNTIRGALHGHCLEEVQYDIADIQCLNLSLMLLNCKNITTINNEPPTKLNKSRIKKGKQPLFAYKTLVIKPTSKRQQSLKAQGLWENRIHLCRGHFKEYTQDKPLFGKYTGRYWWQPSVRGRNRNGVVMKDYRLETA